MTAGASYTPPRASLHPSVQRYARHVNPAFVKLLGAFGYGRAFVRARGTSLWDHEGRAYLDFLAAFGAHNLGHNPPRLIERLAAALHEELPNLVHVGPQVHAGDLAAELTALSRPLDVCLFSSTGGEAVESALKLARAATGRPGIAYAAGGFHGTGLGALSVMGHRRMRAPFGPLLAHCHEVPFGDLAALDKVLASRKIAAFLVEPIQAEAGVILPPPGYLRAARALCARRGALFLLDEVQTGLGRTGTLFAYQAEDLVPDALVLGKSLGGGLIAVAATLTTAAIHRRAFGTLDRFDLHGSTFSGNALGCIAARETLAILRDEGLVEASAARGARLTAGLRAALDGHPLVRDVRGRGLLVAIELGPTDKGGALSRFLPGLVDLVSQRVFGQWLAVRLLERQILCQPASQQWNVLRLEPPLTVTDAEIDRVVGEIAALLGEYRTLAPLCADVATRLGRQIKGGMRF